MTAVFSEHISEQLIHIVEFGYGETLASKVEAVFKANRIGVYLISNFFTARGEKVEIIFDYSQPYVYNVENTSIVFSTSQIMPFLIECLTENHIGFGPGNILASTDEETGLPMLIIR